MYINVILHRKKRKNSDRKIHVVFFLARTILVLLLTPIQNIYKNNGKRFETRYGRKKKHIYYREQYSMQLTKPLKTFRRISQFRNAFPPKVRCYEWERISLFRKLL